MGRVQVTLTNRNDTPVWFKIYYPSGHVVDSVIADMTALSLTLDSGASSLSFMEWSGGAPGSEADWNPLEKSVGIAFTSNGSENFEFPLLAEPVQNVTITIENYNDHFVWFKLQYKNSAVNGVVGAVTALAFTVPQGATEISWMDWNSDSHGTDSQWSPAGGKPFTTNGGEKMKFEPGMDTAGSPPAANVASPKTPSGPTGSVVVELSNHLETPVWFRFVYGNGAFAQQAIDVGARLDLTVPGAMTKVEWTAVATVAVGSDSDWSAAISSGKVVTVAYNHDQDKTFSFGIAPNGGASFEELHPMITATFRNYIPGKHIWMKISYDGSATIEQVLPPEAFIDLELNSNASGLEWLEWHSSQKGTAQQFKAAADMAFKAQQGDVVIFDLPKEDLQQTHIPESLKVDLNMNGSLDDDLIGVAPDLGEDFKAFKASGKKFVDPGFELKTHDGYTADSSFQWRRPNQCSSPALLFPSGGAKGSNVMQGALGDCWFISAMVILATCDGGAAHDSNVPHLEEIFEGSDLELGLIVVRFFKNGRFLYVMVDDQLPVTDGRIPVYARNRVQRPDSLVVSALGEGLMGGYENLDGGSIEYALTDMTGMPPTVSFMADFNIDDLGTGNASPGALNDLYQGLSRTETGARIHDSYETIRDHGTAAEKLKSQRLLLRQLFTKGQSQMNEAGLKQLTGLSAIDGSREEDLGNGILGGHAYAIQGFWDRAEQLLTKIRNPWGDYGWRGDWSDGSSKWTAEAQAEAGYTPGDGGDFYMSLVDVLGIFTHRYNVTLVPDTWCREAIMSMWTQKTAGGQSGDKWGINPQFKFTVPAHSCFMATCDKVCPCRSQKKASMQEDFAMFGRKDEYETIGFSLWKAPKNGLPLDEPWQENFTDIGSIYTNSRSVTKQISHLLPSVALTPGDYIIVATTYEPGKLGRCCVSIIANQHVKLKQIQGVTLCENTTMAGVSTHKPCAASALEEDLERVAADMQQL